MAGLLITGTRDQLTIQQQEVVLLEVAKYWPAVIVIHGGCKTGVDAFMDAWAKSQGVHTAVVEALWDYSKRKAGPLRNRCMLGWLAPDLVLAFPKGDSPGTRNCIEEARRLGKDIIVTELDA